MSVVHRKSEIKCNISSRLSFIIEWNCVLYVIENRTEDKVVNRKKNREKNKILRYSQFTRYQSRAIENLWLRCGEILRHAWCENRGKSYCSYRQLQPSALKMQAHPKYRGTNRPNASEVLCHCWIDYSYTCSVCLNNWKLQITRINAPVQTWNLSNLQL